MAIPKYYEFYGDFLKSLSDGGTHSIKEIKDCLAAAKKLNAEDMTERLPSGKQTIFDNRVGWTRTYLKNSRID